MLTSIASARQQFAAALDEERRCDAEYLRRELGSPDGSRGIPQELPEPTDFQPDQSMSTQAYLGHLLGRLSTVQPGKLLDVLVDRIVTIAADVAYLDRKLILKKPKAQSAGHPPLYLIFNLAIGGSWFGNVTAETDFSQWEMNLKSIEIYSLPDGFNGDQQLPLAIDVGDGR